MHFSCALLAFSENNAGTRFYESRLMNDFLLLRSWLSLLEGTRWLQHMSGLLRAAVTVATAIERDARPVLVHCSDGWDRTPQIVALAQILLDPYYRTIEVR